jgi:hypothetical protein
MGDHHRSIRRVKDRLCAQSLPIEVSGGDDKCYGPKEKESQLARPNARVVIQRFADGTLWFVCVSVRLLERESNQLR